MISFRERLGQRLFPALCVSCGKSITERSPYSDYCRRCCAKLPWRREHERVLPLLSWRFKLLLSGEDRELERKTLCLSALHYRGEIPFLIRSLKFNGRLCNAKPLGEILGDCLIREAKLQNNSNWVITSVPLSLKRQKQRAYNQAEEIARHAARSAGLSYMPLLDKQWDSPKQSEFGFLERLHNVEGIYRARQQLNGCSIVLVDDILTSGATLFSASKALYEANAAHVLCAAAASGRKHEVQAQKHFDD